MTFDECEADLKHAISRRNYDKCKEAEETGYMCDDATPAKGKQSIWHMSEVGSQTKQGTDNILVNSLRQHQSHQ